MARTPPAKVDGPINRFLTLPVVTEGEAPKTGLVPFLRSKTRWQPSKFHAETGVCPRGRAGSAIACRLSRRNGRERQGIRGAMGLFASSFPRLGRPAPEAGA